jgi:uncharacterized phage-associated protein
MGHVTTTDIASPWHVADFLLVDSRRKGELLTNLKLQKLLYYAQAWFLVLQNGRPIFSEDFEAWVHGPVLVSQYNRFKSYEWRPIDSRDVRPPGALPASLGKHLEEVIKVFGSETAVSLELMTHREPPWIKARGPISPTAKSSAKISKQSMLEYYRTLK